MKGWEEIDIAVTPSSIERWIIQTMLPRTITRVIPGLIGRRGMDGEDLLFQFLLMTETKSKQKSTLSEEDRQWVKVRRGGRER